MSELDSQIRQQQLPLVADGDRAQVVARYLYRDRMRRVGDQDHLRAERTDPRDLAEHAAAIDHGLVGGDAGIALLC